MFLPYVLLFTPRRNPPVRGALLTTVALGILLCLMAGMALPSRAQTITETILHTFNANCDGSMSQASLLLGQDGTYYGTTWAGGTNDAGTIFKLSPSGKLTTLHSFTNVTDGANPEAALVQDTDGTLYGTTFGSGTVFKIRPDGTGYAVLHTFVGYEYSPGTTSPVTIGTDGKLYGTTSAEVLAPEFVYSMNKDGSGFTDLHDFSISDGSFPNGGVVQARDGYLYGTTSYGGANGTGIVYKLATDGSQFSIIHSFDALSQGYYLTGGANPNAGLIQGKSPDSMLYGTTVGGGAGSAEGAGTVYKISPDGSSFAQVYYFPFPALYSLPNGANPYAGVIQASNGMLYGTTTLGGPGYDTGTVYGVSPSGGLTNILVDFGPYQNGNIYLPYYGSPGNSGVVQGSDGKLHGTIMTSPSNEGGFGVLYPPPVYQRPYLGAIYSVNPDGSNLTIDFDFPTQGFHDGISPMYGTVARDAQGNLYGTTVYGGDFNGGGNGGTLWRMAPDGTYTILHSFYQLDGRNPEGGVTLYGHVLYGTTNSDGAHTGDSGTVFSYDLTSGVLTTLWNFGLIGSGDAGYPVSAPILVGNTLYGTSFRGGFNGVGAVYAVTLPTQSSGPTEQVLYSFQSGAEGYYPAGSLLLGKDGNLYGTTLAGGPYGAGTLFKLTPTGTETVIHTFDANTGPGYSGLIQDAHGVLYGVAESSAPGSVYSINPDGSSYTSLHQFSIAEGYQPGGSLVLATDGMLYGTTAGFNALTTSDGGAVFRMNTDGSKFATIYSFSLLNGTDGAYPLSGLMEGTDGNLYGTCSAGGVSPFPGTNISGTLFRLNTLLPTPGAPPTLTAVSPAMASIGSPDTTVTLTGTNFVPKSTAVWESASLTRLSTTYVSPTQLTAVIPASLLTVGGNFALFVNNPGVTGGNSSPVAFIVGNLMPVLTSLSPNTVPASSPNTTVTITGTGFVSGAQAHLNNTPLATTFVSSTQLTVIVPAGLLTAPSSMNMTVINPTPSAGPSSPLIFTVNLGTTGLQLVSSPGNQIARVTGGMDVIQVLQNMGSYAASDIQITSATLAGTGSTSISPTFAFNLSKTGTYYLLLKFPAGAAAIGTTPILTVSYISANAGSGTLSFVCGTVH